ncbi:hypothetical protein Cs7R123_77120 [Catellatospora sp. TT07R-123]|nr:hypothetical protein Cs7R123_77120 [Catellatospora sp. TT07R-123]
MLPAARGGLGVRVQRDVPDPLERGGPGHAELLCDLWDRAALPAEFDSTFAQFRLCHGVTLKRAYDTSPQEIHSTPSVKLRTRRLR